MPRRNWHVPQLQKINNYSFSPPMMATCQAISGNLLVRFLKGVAENRLDQRPWKICAVSHECATHKLLWTGKVKTESND